MLAALSRAVGLDLSAYRREHVAAQIDRASAREGVGPEEFARLAAREPSVARRLRSGIAVSVTGLFRDPEQFEFLAAHVIPRLSERGGRLRVWSAGCADGSELLSIATLLGEAGQLERASLLGSDVLPENVDRARMLLLDHPDAAPRVRFEVRDLVQAQPPPGRFSLILCRNVLIYFEPRTKAEILKRLASALAGGGVLLLGRSERLVHPAELGLHTLGPHAYVRDDTRWEPE